jgi:TPR repeat protein
MEVISRQDKNIEVHISLTADVSEVILSNYSLSVSMVSKEEKDVKSFICYTNGLGCHKKNIHIQHPLSYFTTEQRMNAESEEFIIPFTFKPAVGLPNAKLYFELFDKAGILISSANVIWEHTTIEVKKEPSTVLGENQMPITEIWDWPTALKTSFEDMLILPTSEHKQMETDIVSQGKTAASHLSHVKGKERLKEVENEEEVQFEGEKLIIPVEYASMSEQELCKRANKNDLYAQELIARKAMTEGPFLGLLKLATPYHWLSIKEKVQQDGRYIYLLLINPAQIKDNTICELFASEVLKQAQAGVPLAQINLGMMYVTGKGMPRDNKQALKWFICATEKKNGLAYYMMGQIYKYAVGVKKDIKEAIKLHMKAFDLGIIRSKCSIRNIYIESTLVEKIENVEGLSGMEIEEYKSGIEWLTSIADKEEDGNIQAVLGLMYCVGKGVKQNIELGLKWLNMATDYRKKDALSDNHLINAIGDLYYYGIVGIPRNYEKAIALYRKAAAKGLIVAQERLAEMHFSGKGTKQDFAEATFWALKAKYKTWLLNKFEVSSNISSKYNQEKGSFEILGKDLLFNFQRMRARERCSVVERHANMLPDLFEGLSEIVNEFAKLGKQIKYEPGLLINCLNFKNVSFKDGIQEHQIKTGMTPYIKGYEYKEKNYISFGRPSVRLADQLLEEHICHTHYDEALTLLEIIKYTYKKTQIKLSYEVKETKKKLSDLCVSEKIRKEILLKELNKKISTLNIFNDKLKLLKITKKQFMSFYELLFEQIEKEAYIRNKQFRVEYSYLFN